MGKLQNRRGETLVETLIAVLVLALAVALLAGMTSAAVRLDRKTDQATAELYEAFSAAEQQTTPIPGSVTVKIGESERSANVNFYGDADQVVSYRAESGGGSTP